MTVFKYGPWYRWFARSPPVSYGLATQHTHTQHN